MARRTSPLPVSYTHLDVYKRQDLKRWGLLDSQAGIDELKARDKDFNNFIVGKHRRLPIPREMCIRDRNTNYYTSLSYTQDEGRLKMNSTVGGVAHLTPVSYTHLDVYKRQLFPTIR